MSRHEGVSCDSCLKGNFRGRRYKCLICYDYDLCSTCYEAGATTTRHTTEHAMQCILTRTDFDLYYGGEALTTEQPQSFTCPYCSKMGYVETTLHDHVTADHTDAQSQEVVCPVCASLPGGEPNHVTDDFASHLTLEHRTPRDYDEPAGMHHVRRIPHPGRGVSGSRTRRANMHFTSSGSTLSGLSPSGRETMDPIAELLSQLSSVRSRAAAAQSVTSQLQQLEMQLQTTRQQLERLPRRQAEAKASLPSSAQNGSSDQTVGTSSLSNSPYLLAKCNEENSFEQDTEYDRGMFVQELLLTSLMEHNHVSDESDALIEPLLEHLKLPSTTEDVVPEKRVSPPSSNVHSGHSKVVKPASQDSSRTTASSQKSAPSSVARQHTVAISCPGGTRQVFNSLQGAATTASGCTTASGSNSTLLQIQSRASGHTRDRVNPASAKRNLLKHMPPPQASDTEPPPH